MNVLRDCLSAYARLRGVLVCLLFGLLPLCGAESITLTVATGRSVTGTLDLNSYGSSTLTSITCQMAGGGSYPNGGSGTFVFDSQIGTYASKTTVAGTGGGGGSSSVVLLNLSRNSSGVWTVGQVQKVYNGNTSTVASSVVLASSSLSYSASCTVPVSSGTATASMQVVYPASGFPSASSVTGNGDYFFVNEGVSFVFSGTDTDKDLTEMSVMCQEPDGVVKALTGWVLHPEAGQGKETLQWRPVLPAFEKVGVHEFWVCLRDAQGHERDPKALGKLLEIRKVHVLPALPKVLPSSVEPAASLPNVLVDQSVTGAMQGSLDLNQYGALWVDRIECVVSGGGTGEEIDIGDGEMVPGPGLAYFSVSLGGKAVQYTVGGDGDVGGEVRIRLSNVRRLTDTTWQAGLVEYLGVSPAKAPEQDVSLDGGVLSYATSVSTQTMATWTANASLKLTYTPNNAPSSTTLSGLPSGALVGSRVSVVAAATDPDSNLASLQVCWKTPSGVVQTLMDWTTAFSGDTASASRECVLPAFTQTGTYTVFVNARDKLGATRLPLSSGLTEELHTLVVGVVPGDLQGSGVGKGWEDAIRADSNRSKDYDGNGIINAVEPHIGGSLSEWSSSELPLEWDELTAKKPWIDQSERSVAVGVTSGEMSVDKNGALSYTLPLRAVPGTAGMEPKLSLVYSSQSGPGVAGYGWSLSGLSSITRGPQTLAVDKQIVGVTGTDTDRFYLDGQRLIAIDGKPDGGHLTEYRTENESFSRVVSYGYPGANDPKGPRYWKVWTKAGLVYELGGTDEARASSTSANCNLSWVVNRITDTCGNYMTFSYGRNGDTGSPLLSSVWYTMNETTGQTDYASLSFEYDDRPDKSVGYQLGTKLGSTKRLTRVFSRYKNMVVRSLELDYYPATGKALRSVLKSLTEVSHVGGTSVLPALTFEYSETGTEGFEYSAAYAPPTDAVKDDKHQGSGYVDVNGDGLPDLVKHTCTASGGSLERAAWINTGSGWQRNDTYAPPRALSYEDGKSTGAQFIDLDGDGLVDFIQSKHDQACAAYRNTGTGWEYKSNWNLPSGVYVKTANANEPRYFIDLNGDGLVDFVYRNDGSAGAYLNVSNTAGSGNIWQYCAAYVPPGGSSPGGFANKFDQHTIYTDLNGDGLPDMLTHVDNDRTFQGVALNRGIPANQQNELGSAWRALVTGSTEYNKYMTPHALARYHDSTMGENTLDVYACELRDINGDGLVDLLYGDKFHIEPYDIGEVYLNTGNGWLRDPGYNFPLMMGDKGANEGVAVIDINCDGLADIVRREGSGSSSDKMEVQYGIPGGFGALLTQAAIPLPLDKTIGTGVKAAGTDFVDLNGDGAVDMVQACQGQRRAYLNKASPHFAMTKVTTGLGVSASVVYERLNEEGCYVRGPGATYPVREVTGPLYVVSELRNDDGAGGVYSQNYLYGPMRSNAKYGSLGFEWVSIQDGRTRIRNTTVYSQEFPTIGMPLESFTTTQAGALLASSSTQYAVRPYNHGLTRLVYASSTEEESRDLNNALMKWTRTRYGDGTHEAFDDFGNVTFMSVEQVDGSRLETVSSYTNTTETVWDSGPGNSKGGKWLLGRLARTSVSAYKGPGSSSPVRTRTSSFGYNAQTGLLETEIVEPDLSLSDPLHLETTYTHDAYGNRTSVTVKGQGLPAEGRTTSTDYTVNIPSGAQPGRFAWKTTNAKGHFETYDYDLTTGLVKSQTGPNGLTTTWKHDAFGRKISEIRADGTRTDIVQGWVNGLPELPDACYYQETQTSCDSLASPPSLTFFDKYGREIAAYSVNAGRVGSEPYAVGSRKWYDSFGRAWKSSLPKRYGDAFVEGARTEAYDLLGRPLQTSTPHETLGRVYVSYNYNGLETTSTAPAISEAQPGQTVLTKRDTLGRTTSVTTHALLAEGSVERGQVSYVYDDEGRMVETRVATQDGESVTKFTYDLRGRKVRMEDPSMGTWTYVYNSVGELVSQTDSLNQAVTMNYDSLGRMISRVEAEGTTTWTYDTSPRSGGKTWLGSLHTVGFVPKRKAAAIAADARAAGAEVAAELPSTEVTLYDDLGRVSSQTRNVELWDDFGSWAGDATLSKNRSYTSAVSYDALGRVATSTSPAGLIVRNVYSQSGFLVEVWDEGTASRVKRLLWRADGFALNGMVDAATYGNGITFDRIVNPVTGRVQAITAGVGVLPNAEYICYDYDAVGNVVRRNDLRNVRDEEFEYDALYRITNYKMNGVVSQWVSYDRAGNLRSKKELGTYHYDNGKPYSVSHVEKDSGAGLSFTYDAMGRMLASSAYGPVDNALKALERTQSWTSFSQLKHVRTGNRSSVFFSDAGHQRMVQVRRDESVTNPNTNTNAVLEVTLYVGANYEEVFTKSIPVPTRKSYVMSPLGRTAVFEQRAVPNGSNLLTDTFKFFHQDGLGSIMAVSNEFGMLESRWSYDPWGKRNQEWLGKEFAEGSGAQPDAKAPTRGFTDHEHLEEHGLIHMNGRVFDPILARFLSADPFVDDATDAQAYNRYSYVSNNPLNHTDPSGYFKLNLMQVVAMVAVVVLSVITAGAAIAAWGVTMTGSMATGFTVSCGSTFAAAFGSAAVANAVIGGLAAGFVSGFAGSLLSGGSLGDAFKAGVIGGAIGAITGGLAGKIGDTFGHSVGSFSNEMERAAAHGIVSGGAGELQGDSFKSGFASGFIGSLTGSSVMSKIEGNSWRQVAERTTVSALAGGAASAIGGGKFANGALTASIQHLFNAEGGYWNGVADAGSGIALGILEGFGWEVYDGVEVGNWNIDTGRKAGRLIGTAAGALKSLGKGLFKGLWKGGVKMMASQGDDAAKIAAKLAVNAADDTAARLARKVGLNPASKTTVQIVANWNTPVRQFISKHRLAKIVAVFPSEYLDKTVGQALLEGGSTVRKLITDTRFSK